MTPPHDAGGAVTLTAIIIVRMNIIPKIIVFFIFYPYFLIIFNISIYRYINVIKICIFYVIYFIGMVVDIW